MKTTELKPTENVTPAPVGSGGLAPSPCWAPSSYFGGCDKHRDRTDLSCCKIRRQDGSPLTTADAWEEIQRLRAALKWAEAYGAWLGKPSENLTKKNNTKNA